MNCLIGSPSFSSFFVQCRRAKQRYPDAFPAILGYSHLTKNVFASSSKSRDATNETLNFEILDRAEQREKRREKAGPNEIGCGR